MKQVKLRDFQRNPQEHLASLPITVMAKDVPLFVVVAPNHFVDKPPVVNKSVDKPKTVQEIVNKMPKKPDGKKIMGNIPTRKSLSIFFE